MESHFNKFVPEQAPYCRHTYEGDDDMPAHIKASTLGTSVTIPINNGRLALGTWQGICQVSTEIVVETALWSLRFKVSRRLKSEIFLIKTMPS